MPPKKYPRSIRAKDAHRVLSRCYASANLRQPKDYYDDSLTLDFGPLDNFVVLKQVGRGKYGEVFEVRCLHALVMMHDRSRRPKAHGSHGTHRDVNVYTY